MRHSKIMSAKFTDFIRRYFTGSTIKNIISLSGRWNKPAQTFCTSRQYADHGFARPIHTFLKLTSDYGYSPAPGANNRNGA